MFPRRLHVLLPMMFALAVSPAGAKPKTKIETKISFQPRYYFKEIGKDTNQGDTPITLEPSVGIKTSRAWRFRFAPYYYTDPASVSIAERSLLDVNEANTEYRFGDSRLSLGFNQIAWGVTDVFNPLDVASSRRYFDLLNSEKRAVPSLVLKHESGDWRWEALYVPVQLPSVLPGNNSRWLPRDFIYKRDENLLKIVLPSVPHFQYVDDNEIDGALQHNFGARVEVHKSGLDLSAVFFQGAPTVPSIMPILRFNTEFDSQGQPVPVAEPNIRLRPDYYWKNTIGGSAVVTLESSIIRFATAYSDRLTGPSYLPGWQHASVLGLEHNIPIMSSTLTALLQMTYVQNQIQAENTATSLDRIFDRSVMLGFRLATSNEWTLTTAGLYDGVNQGVFVQARAEKKIADGITGSIQGEMIEGQAGTPLGSYTHNDRLGLGLSIFF